MVENIEKISQNTHTLEALIATSTMVQNARKIAQKIHDGQIRNDGTPYFTHCESVARIACEELEITDPEIISALYLHDGPEDTQITLEDIKLKFTDKVASIVDGMTKIKQGIREDGTPLSKEERERLTEKKAFFDPVVAVCKCCCDRLHNMRTLQFVPQEKQKPKAQETLIYAKLLESLGVWTKMIELEDLSLMYLEPDAYQKFKNMVSDDPRTSPDFIGNMTTGLRAIIPNEIKTTVSYKINGLTRLKNKMEKTPDVKDVNDLISFRIVVDEADDDKSADKCYQILRILQEKFALEENQDRYDNFYFKPKINGYSAIQITLNTVYGAVEVAITSKKKEEFNNWGVVSLIRNGVDTLKEYSQIMVFTPKDQARFLPKGATAIDFAYSISPDLGASAVKAVIDGIDSPMTSVLQNGQKVLIEFDQIKSFPNPEWLKNPRYCKPETAETINEQLLNEKRYKLINQGKEKIIPVITKRGIYDLSDLDKFEIYKAKLSKMLLQIGCKNSLNNLYFQIASGYISLERLDDQLNYFDLTPEKMKLTTIVIEGNDRKGILEKVGKIIGGSHGNIGALSFERYGQDKFNLRLVIEGLDHKSNGIISDKILACGFVTNVNIY